MPRESCLDHPKRDRVLILRDYQVKMCGGDVCAAAVLSLIEYLTNNLMENAEDAGQTIVPWVTLSLPAFCASLFKLYSSRRIQDRLQFLSSNGLIDIDSPGKPKPNRYLLNQDRVNHLLVTGECFRFEQDKCPVENENHNETNVQLNADECPVKQRQMSACTETNVQLNDLHIRKETLDYLDNNTDQPIFLSQDQSQNQLPLSTEQSAVTDQTPLSAPAAPCDEKHSKTQSTSYQLQLETEVCKFVKRAYDQRQRVGREIDATGEYITGNIAAKTHKMRPKIEEAERKCSPVEFRLALWCYLDTDDDKLRAARWPLNWFLKEPLRYLPEIPHWPPSDRPVLSPRLAPRRTSSDAPANAPTGFSPIPGDPLKNPLTYLDSWNTIVYDSPVDVDAVPSFTMAGLKKAISGGDFEKCYERVFEKCQRMNANGQSVKFDGLFIGYVPLWQKIYAGTEDWKMGKEDIFAQVQAAAEREERGGL